MYFRRFIISFYFTYCKGAPIVGKDLVPGLFTSSQSTGDIAGVNNVVDNSGGEESFRAASVPWMMQPYSYPYPSPMMMPPQQVQQPTFFIQDPKTDNPQGPLSELNSASLTEPLPPGQTV
jgi:hypothetical protein